ncbi:MAG TPA: hypothetical protein VFV11_09540 [Solimonas sp.]|nr:hypothetical protein [Solimonas sp.]
MIRVASLPLSLALGLSGLLLAGCVTYPVNSYHSSLDPYCCDANGYWVYPQGYYYAPYPYVWYGPSYYYYDRPPAHGHHHSGGGSGPQRPSDDDYRWSGWPGNARNRHDQEPERRTPRDPGRVSQSAEPRRPAPWAPALRPTQDPRPSPARPEQAAPSQDRPPPVRPKPPARPRNSEERREESQEAPREKERPGRWARGVLKD